MIARMPYRDRQQNMAARSLRDRLRYLIKVRRHNRINSQFNVACLGYGGDGHVSRWAIMKRLLLISLILLVVVGSIVLVTKRRQEAKLDGYRKFIESTYASEIALIEQRATELPDPDDWSEEAIAQTDTIANDLQTALSKSEVFSASWSLDGHHGLQSLKPMDTNGYSTHSNWFGSHDADQLHSLCYGETFLGRYLLVYEGWVPAGINRSYRIAFYRTAIDSAARQ